MHTRLMNLWASLRSSLWFVPGVMVATAVLGGQALVELDRALGITLLEREGELSSDGAREILSTVAGSMITVAGVVFSITIVSLTLASSQFGPRLLRTFMRDTGNQVVLGTFLATFVYCLLVLQTVRGSNNGEEAFVPSISLAVGLVLTLASLAVLIYFIHHVAASIQADSVAAHVMSDLQIGLNRLYPQSMGLHMPEPDSTRDSEEEFLARFENGARALASRKSGYVTAVDSPGLMKLAAEHDLSIRMERRPGNFVNLGQTLAVVWPGERVDERVENAVRKAFILGRQRTPEQDVEFTFLQLAEVAVRALSPGINDPFTAMVCVDRIGEGLSLLAGRVIPSPFRHDDSGTLRIYAEPVTFSTMADVGFDQIRHYGRGNYVVMSHMLHTIAVIAGMVRREDDRAALIRQAVMIERDSREAVVDPLDRDRMERQYWTTMAALRPGEDAARPADGFADTRQER